MHKLHHHWNGLHLTRHEIFVCVDDEVEKLVVGLLERLLPYLLEVHNKCILKDLMLYIQTTSNKRTQQCTMVHKINFEQFAGSPDLVNISRIMEGEISQSEETRKFHLSLYAKGHQDCSQSGETDTSKNELLRARDLRLTALKRELATALSRAFGAICSCKEIT
ncbi:hypothetical protein SADUNF_Sadunf13G0069200 [Salix dunnii]|uniref:Uncharacterized protein n=1 Tax=Salix dunnii TaxID=1413687 RepID=A0A835JGT8_9ROSI|nr:hypothetical protein SADUNF_Sadunf13G0069200 [Salix dunnii]